MAPSLSTSSETPRSSSSRHPMAQHDLGSDDMIPLNERSYYGATALCVAESIPMGSTTRFISLPSLREAALLLLMGGNKPAPPVSASSRVAQGLADFVLQFQWKSQTTPNKRYHDGSIIPNTDKNKLKAQDM